MQFLFFHKISKHHRGIMNIDKRVLNFLVIITLSFTTFLWTFFIFHMPFELNVVLSVILVRMVSSFVIFSDYSLSWSKASQKTFLIKSFVYIVAFLVYLPLFYGKVRFAFLLSELFFFLFAINFAMYLYYYILNKNRIRKTKTVVIYGAGRAGIKLESEFANTQYRVKYFIDDDKIIQNRSIDSTQVISKYKLKEKIGEGKFDLLVIAMPSAGQDRIKEIYDNLSEYFNHIQILPSLDEIFEYD